MHRFRFAVAVAALFTSAACATQTEPRPPPPGAFYFPTGVVHLDGAGEGFLYVVSSNFDQRFDHGQVSAVDLSALGLPALGNAASAPVEITELKIGAGSRVVIDNLAGELAVRPSTGGPARLFVPSRSDEHKVQPIDASGVQLSCPTAPGSTDCRSGAPSLVALQKVSITGRPRAPEPLGLAVSTEGQVYVAHLRAADSPPETGRDGRAYLVQFAADNPVVDEGSFQEIGPSGSHGVAVGPRYVMMTGRTGLPQAPLVRLVDRQQPNRVVEPRLESGFRVIEGRGIAASPDGKRIYIAGRAPDLLVVIEVDDPLADEPKLRVVRSAALPPGPMQVAVIPRATDNLVVVTCSTSGVVALYADGPGQLVAEMGNVGSQPFAIAVDRQGIGARLYITNFTDGRVAVIDVADLDQPHQARVVAYLGASQTCLTDNNTDCGASQ
jgi:DNA-binding beta-propeller fold protein YncE